MTAARKPRKAAPRAGSARTGQRSAKPGASSQPRTGRAGARSGSSARPTGFAPWLWLLVIGQLLVTARMIDTLIKMANVVGTAVWKSHPALVTTDLVLYGAAFLLQLVVLATMAMRKRAFVPLFITAVVVYFLISRAEALLAIVFLGMDPARLLTRAVMMPIAVELCVGLLWTAYVLRSRRVRSTFVR